MRPLRRALSSSRGSAAARRAEEDAVVRSLTAARELPGLGGGGGGGGGPPLSLRLITPGCALYDAGASELAAAPCGPEPWWGFCWPGSYAIAECVRVLARSRCALLFLLLLRPWSTACRADPDDRMVRKDGVAWNDWTSQPLRRPSPPNTLSRRARARTHTAAKHVHDERARHTPPHTAADTYIAPPPTHTSRAAASTHTLRRREVPAV